MLHEPHRVAADVLDFLRNPLQDIPGASISCMISAVMVCGYLAYVNVRWSPQQTDSPCSD